MQDYREVGAQVARARLHDYDNAVVLSLSGDIEGTQHRWVMGIVDVGAVAALRDDLEDILDKIKRKEEKNAKRRTKNRAHRPVRAGVVKP